MQDWVCATRMGMVRLLVASILLRFAAAQGEVLSTTKCMYETDLLEVLDILLQFEAQSLRRDEVI